MKNNQYKFIPVIILFALFGIFSSAALAAPPSNDNMSSAQTLSGPAGLTNDTVAEATREQNEESHALASGATVNRTVWYQWTATEDKPAVFEVTTNNFDASLAVYTIDNGQLKWISLNNDTINGRPRVEFGATAGTTYKIVVGVYNTNSLPQGGAFTLMWMVNAAATNDNFANARSLPPTVSGDVAITNQNATKESNEPAHVAGSRSVWVTYTNSQPFDYSVTFRTRRLSFAIDTTLAVYTGTNLQNLSPVVKNRNEPASSTSALTFLAKAGVTYFIAVDEGTSPNQWNGILAWNITDLKKYTDFGTSLADRQVQYDHAADISVFRPSDGTWWIRDSWLGSIRAVKFGQNGDVPVPADYDGDGRTDLAVTRDTPGGKVFYIANSFDETNTILQWGLTGDKPVIGDYDYDGRADIAVFRPSNGTWYVRRSSDGALYAKQFGFADDIPVSHMDYKGTAAGSDLAVYRPSNGTWYILNGSSTIFIPFGTNGDVPVAADYDYDTKTDVGVYRPSTGDWYTLRFDNSDTQQIHWGAPGDIALTGDYDNNTNDIADFAVFRPGENRWYILKSEGNVVDTVQFGADGDVPVTSSAHLIQ